MSEYMKRRLWIIKRPNGRYARFCEQHNTFSHTNMTTADIRSALLKWSTENEIQEELAAADDDTVQWYEEEHEDGLNRYRTSLRIIVGLRGEDEHKRVKQCVESGIYTTSCPPSCLAPFK